jgi:hypothetical protein
MVQRFSHQLRGVPDLGVGNFGLWALNIGACWGCGLWRMRLGRGQRVAYFVSDRMRQDSGSEGNNVGRFQDVG